MCIYIKLCTYVYRNRLDDLYRRIVIYVKYINDERLLLRIVQIPEILVSRRTEYYADYIYIYVYTNVA